MFKLLAFLLSIFDSLTHRISRDVWLVSSLSMIQEPRLPKKKKRERENDKAWWVISCFSLSAKFYNESPLSPVLLVPRFISRNRSISPSIILPRPASSTNSTGTRRPESHSSRPASVVDLPSPTYEPNHEDKAKLHGIIKVQLPCQMWIPILWSKYMADLRQTNDPNITSSTPRESLIARY